MTALASRARSAAWRHPEWWVVAVALAAWAALAASVAAPESPHSAHVHAVEGAAPPALVAAALMAVAMMAPMGVPAARYVALTTFASRRHRSQAAFLTGYLGAWTVIAVATGAATAALAGATGEAAALTAAFALAAAWQLSGTKRRALTRCRAATSVTADGWRATRDCIAYGVRHAGRCAVTCGCLMAAAAAAGHALPVMAGVFAIQVHERVTRAYRPLAGAAFVALLGAAAVASA